MARQRLAYEPWLAAAVGHRSEAVLAWAAALDDRWEAYSQHGWQPEDRPNENTSR